MKANTFLFLLIFNIPIVSQNNSLDPNLTGIKNLKVTVYLCPEDNTYEYLQYEVYRDVTHYLKNAGIKINEDENSNFLLSINMNCGVPRGNSIAINLSFSLSERVYLKRIKSYEYASLYDREGVAIISKGVKDFDFIKSSIIDFKKTLILIINQIILK